VFGCGLAKMVRQTSDCPAILGDGPSARSSRRIGTAKISRINGNSRTTEDDVTLIERPD